MAGKNRGRGVSVVVLAWGLMAACSSDGSTSEGGCYRNQGLAA